MSLTDKILDLLVDTICVVDSEGRFVFLSAACKQLLGYEPEELIGRNMIDLVHPDDRERTLAAAANVMNGQPHAHFENRYIRKDGRVVDIMWSARWSSDEGLRLAVARDVTQPKRAARRQHAMYRISEASHSAEGLSALFSSIYGFMGELLPVESFYVAIYDEPHDMLSFPFFFDTREQWPGPVPLSSGSLVARVIREGRPLLASTGRSGAEPAGKPAGDARPRNWLGAPLVAESGVMGAVVVQSPPTGPGYDEDDRELMQFVATQIAATIELKRRKAQLLHMAHHDPLTDLPNRTLFRDRLQTALKRARRETEHLAVLYLDLRDFKEVNDTLGHAAGDDVLTEMGRRIAGCVRESDTVCRIGGDEFTVLLNNIRWSDNVEVVTDKIREVITAPLAIEGRDLSLSVDIGTAVYPQDGEDEDTLLRHADAAMYLRKRDSRG